MCAACRCGSVWTVCVECVGRNPSNGGRRQRFSPSFPPSPPSLPFLPSFHSLHTPAPHYRPHAFASTHLRVTPRAPPFASVRTCFLVPLSLGGASMRWKLFIGRLSVPVPPRASVQSVRRASLRTAHSGGAQATQPCTHISKYSLNFIPPLLLLLP